jgi:alpha-L-fucosidase
MASYSSVSPWSNTLQNNLYLELLVIKPVPSEADDFYYQIESHYTYRPDLLSYDLYGTPKLWWVFVQRNMNVLRDPIFDFVAGQKIFIPKKSNLQKYMSL